MAYVYEAMDRAKEAICSHYVDKGSCSSGIRKFEYCSSKNCMLVD